MVEQAGKPSPRREYCSNVSDGVRYSQEDLDFLRAIDQYKQNYRRPFPEWWEVLWVAKKLGYRKVGPDGTVSDSGS